VQDRPHHAPGSVSIWLVKQPLSGLHRDYLEGCDQLFMWLMTDYDVAIDGAFATNFTRDGEPGRLAPLLEELHGSERFLAPALAAARARGHEQASFVVALYDCGYDPAAHGLRLGEHESEWFAFVGAFRYE
jgi:hypothetical protein